MEGEKSEEIVIRAHQVTINMPLGEIQVDDHTTAPYSAYASWPASKSCPNDYHEHTTVYGQDTQDGNVVVEENVQCRRFHLDLRITGMGELRYAATDRGGLLRA